MFLIFSFQKLSLRTLKVFRNVDEERKLSLDRKIYIVLLNPYSN